MSNQLDGRNRRQKQRFNIRLQVVVIVERQGIRRPYSFVTRNISESGLFIYGGQDFVPANEDQYLDLTIQLDERGDGITIGTEIMHRQGSMNGFGLRITRIDEDDLRRLSEFIHDYATKYPDSLVE